MLEQSGTLRISHLRLNHNVSLFRHRCPPSTRLCATVKANAYGHGVAEITPLLIDAGMDWFCVYSLAEARNLASHAGGKPILILAPIVIPQKDTAHNSSPEELVELLHNDTIRYTITDEHSACQFSQLVQSLHPPHPVNVHIQVDTGLTRQGVALKTAESLVRSVLGQGVLRLEGLFTHLSHGDSPNHAASSKQLSLFENLRDRVKELQPTVLFHAQNSGGAWHWPDIKLDMVRLGIGLYGLQPSVAEPISDLQPIASLHAPITALHDRPAGTGVGYGHTHILERKSRLAIVPVGYADGYPRALSNTAMAEVNGTLVPVVGRVSMDQTILDVTEATASIGQNVTLISANPASPLAMDKLATICNTIGYELATGLGRRLSRVVV